jgi:Zn-dependent protease/CBS domain-containing protein
MFTRTFELLKIFGISLRIDLSWFVIAVLLTWSLATGFFPVYYGDLQPADYWSMGVGGTLGLFVSIVLHELGHSVVALRHGIQIRGITLFIFGGVAEMADEPPNAKAEFLVAIGGPAVSVAIALVCWAGWEAGMRLAWPVQVVAVLGYLALINAILVAFNMIPAFPLDGGRVLRAILWHFQGSLRRATRVTSAIGSLFGIVLIGLGLVSFLGGNLIGGIWFFVLGMFLRWAAQMSYRQLLVRRALEGEPVSRFMQPDVKTVPPWLTLQELLDDYVYRYHHQMFPVVREGQLVGCVTTHVLREVPREEWGVRRVDQVADACAPDNTIESTADAMQALAKMTAADTSRLMVVDGGQLRGVLGLKDLMRFISLKTELEELDGRAGG